VEVQLNGWDVVLVERNALNHTYVEVASRPAVQLRPGERRVIGPGVRVRLADVASFVMERPAP
jgi:hypothetical protein